MKLTVAVIIGISAFNASTAEGKTFLTFLPVALVADAINNLSDMASSIVTLVGFKIAAKPADKEHPFGHERIEYIAGLVVSTIVIVLAVELFRSSLEKVIGNVTVDYNVLTIVILAVSVLIKLIQSYFNYGVGKAIDSQALKATSLDSLTDSIATFCIMALYDVVQFEGTGSDWLLYKCPRNDYNTRLSLIVGPGQIAICVHNGKIEKILEEGKYVLNTDLLPFVKTLVEGVHGGKNAYPMEVYFINKRLKLDTYWGTSDPIKLVDPEYHEKQKNRSIAISSICNLRLGGLRQ